MRARLDRMSEADQIESLRHERDLYRRLLSLGAESELEPFLEEALGLVVELTGARQGYLELADEPSGDADSCWWLARGCSDDEVDGIRSAISRGIVAQALATGETIVTPSAMLDPRFRARDSVSARRIEAVVCAPIGRDSSLGVVYLQGARGAGPFSDEDRERVELFARHLAPFAERVLARHREHAQTDPTRRLRERLRIEGVVGRSAALAAVLEQAALAAPLDVNVLLLGASGTGKSQLAQVIHDNGPRASGPFVELNCAALPETLVESELFGARAGAHSTAQRAVEGKVAAATGGTLFLDEIAELPVPSQAKLLQLLQSKQYYPLGASQAARADIRLIAASNADLEQAVRARAFREDLFYRLQVLPIRLPKLAERTDDVPLLARHFCAAACARHGLARIALSPGALHAIAASEWPGNVRQLAHAVEAAVIRASGEGAGGVERRHVFPDASGRTDVVEPMTFQEATRRFQRDLVAHVLTETEWNVAEAARRLDLARSHLYNLIHAFELERKKE
jgi:Nif-specific regulatory protein